MPRYSQQINSLRERMMERVEKGVASDSDVALLHLLNLMQQGYQERNDSERQAALRDDQILKEIKQIRSLMSPKPGDRTGVVTWPQLASDFKTFWAFVLSVPTLLSVIAIFMATRQ